MAGEKLPAGPNEGNVGGRQQVVDKFSLPYRTNIADNFLDIHQMKFYAKEIELKPRTFDEAVKILLQQKAEGKNCFITFNKIKIYSADTNSIDDAYMQYYGMTKSEWEERKRKEHEERVLSEIEMKKREQGYAKKIAESRDGVEEVKITKENVVAGLKFIVEHQDMKQEELIDELIKLGCNFTFDDLKRQFPREEKLFPGMKKGHLGCGASVIINYMVSERGRSYVEDRFLSVDDDTSAYAFIRKVTGDKSYTKERIDSSKEKNIMDRGG